VHAVRTHKSPWSDSSDQNGGSPSPRAPNGGNTTSDPSRSRSPRFSEEYYRGNSSSDEDDTDDDEGGGMVLENGNDGGSGEKRKMMKSEKRRKFQEARKAHYGMKEALKKAKQLLINEAEEDEDLGDAMVEANDS